MVAVGGTNDGPSIAPARHARFCRMGGHEVTDRARFFIIQGRSLRTLLSFLMLANHDRTVTMDWNRVEGNWKQFKGKVKDQWGKTHL